MADPNGKSPEEWTNEYELQHAALSSITSRLRTLLGDLLANAKIEVVSLDSRTKTPASFQRKVEEKGDKYDNPLDEITDLIGLRIITYYLEDVDAVGELIERQFEIDWDNTIDKATAFATDQFGYVSVHYVVSLDSSRNALPEWTDFTQRCAEIQVRTATQHAWAAIDHKLSYRTADEVPDELRRRLSRLSALFELADEQFSSLRQASRAVEDSYARQLGAGNLGIPLDVQALDAYLDHSGALESLSDQMRKAGFQPATEEDTGASRAKRDRKDLLTSLFLVRSDTISDLDVIVRDDKWIQAMLPRLSDAYDQQGLSKRLLPDDILTQLVFCWHKPKKMTIRQIYRPNATDAMYATRKSPPE